MKELIVTSLLVVFLTILCFWSEHIGYKRGEYWGHERGLIDGAARVPFFKSNGCMFGRVVDREGKDLYTQVTGCNLTPGSDNRAFIERFENSLDLHLPHTPQPKSAKITTRFFDNEWVGDDADSICPEGCAVSVLNRKPVLANFDVTCVSVEFAKGVLMPNWEAIADPNNKRCKPPTSTK